MPVNPLLLNVNKLEVGEHFPTWLRRVGLGRDPRGHSSWNQLLIAQTSRQLWAEHFAEAHITFRDTHFHFWQVQTEPGQPHVILTSGAWTFHSVALNQPAIWDYQELLQTQPSVHFKTVLYPSGSPLSPA